MSMNSLSRSIVTFLAIGFALLATAGCGSSNNDFVAVNNDVIQTVNAGNLLFRFQRPAAQTIVSANTNSLQFDFHDTSPPNDTSLVFSEERLFNERIVFTDVSSSVVFVSVTELDSRGGLVNRLSASLNVVPNGETEVDLTTAETSTLAGIQVTPDPAVIVVNSFLQDTGVPLTLLGSFGEEQAPLSINSETTSFDLSSSSIFQISETGELSANSFLFTEPALNATATATYTLNGVTQRDTFDLEAFIFTPIGTFALFGGDTVFPIRPGGDVESADGGFNLARPDGTERIVAPEEMTIEFLPEVAGVAIEPDGIITVSHSVPLGTEFSVNYTFMDDGVGGSGRVLNATFDFIVIEGGVN